MSYKNWPLKAHTVSLLPWVKVEGLIKFLESIPKTDLSNKKQRNQLCETFVKLQLPVFSKRIRFPEEPYICLALNECGLLLFRIYALLQNFEGELSLDHKSFIYASNIEIMKKISTLTGVFDRESFEDRYSVKWS